LARGYIEALIKSEHYFLTMAKVEEIQPDLRVTTATGEMNLSGAEYSVKNA